METIIDWLRRKLRLSDPSELTPEPVLTVRLVVLQRVGQLMLCHLHGVEEHGRDQELVPGHDRGGPGGGGLTVDLHRGRDVRR